MPAAPVSITAPTPAPSTSTSSKRKRPSEPQPEPQSESTQSIKNEKKSKKARKALEAEKQKEEEEATLVEKKYQNKSNKKDSEESVKGKGKGKEVEETSEDVEMNDDVEEEDKSDEELLEDDDEGQDIEALDSEGEDEDENAPPPVHESLLKDSKSNGKSNKKNKDDDEPKEVKDRRTLFIGNLPIEAVKSRSITKALKKHLISFSPYPTLTSISSIRYRSIPFSTPTDDFIAGDDEASAKAAKRRERTATYREAQALADKEENGDDPSSSSTNQVKSYLNSRQKRKVAFIKQDFNSHASSVNAYVTLNQVDLEEVKKLREEYQEEEGEGIPIPPINLNGSLLASLISNISNNTVFQKRHLRIDLVTPLSVNDLLQSGLEKTSSLFKAMIPSTSASNSNGSGGATIGRDEKKTLFVGNLDFEASEEDLREFFEDLLIEERGNPPENEGGKSLRSLVFERRKKADPISDKAKESKDDEEDEDGDSDSDSDSEDGGEEESSSSWVSSVRIIRDPSTQLGKGFAYVLFKDETCVDELMALHETEETFLNSGRPQVGGMRGKGKDLVAPPSNYGKEFRRRLKFKKRPLRLSRCKSGGNKGKGGRTWGAAPLSTVELLKLFRKQVGLKRNSASNQSLESTSFLRSKPYNILELGAGTGLVGLALAKFLNNQWKFVGNGKSRVVLTDYHPHVMKNLNHNVWLNGWNSSQDQDESERTESERETSKLVKFVQSEKDRKKGPRFDTDRVEVEVKSLDWQEIHHSLQKGTGDQQEVDGNEKYVSSAQTLPFEKQIHAERTSETKDEPKEGFNRKFGKVDENQKFDLLIAADCIYDPYHPEWIKSVATRHLSKPRSIPRPNQTSTSNPEPSADFSTKPSSYPTFARNQLHILSPLRETHQTEIEAIYKTFPLFDWNRDQNQEQEQENNEKEMELMITNIQDLEGFDDFGSPKLDLERKSSSLDQSRDEEIDEDERSRLLRLLEAGKELARRKESMNRNSSEVRKYRWFVIEWR